MKPSDLFWVEFRGGAGHAQAGRRPAIVVQNTNATGRLPTILAVPLTTQLDALRFPGAVLVEADKRNGLRKPSVALVFQLSVVDQGFLGKKLGRVSEEIMRALWAAFDEITWRPAPESPKS